MCCEQGLTVGVLPPDQAVSQAAEAHTANWWLSDIGNESVPIQLAQCWFPRLAISNAKILIYLSNKIYGSNSVKHHSESLMVRNYTKLAEYPPANAGGYPA